MVANALPDEKPTVCVYAYVCVHHLCVTVDFIELLKISYDFDVVLKTHVSEIARIVCVYIFYRHFNRAVDLQNTRYDGRQNM